MLPPPYSRVTWDGKWNRAKYAPDRVMEYTGHEELYFIWIPASVPSQLVHSMPASCVWATDSPQKLPENLGFLAHSLQWPAGPIILNKWDMPGSGGSA